MIDENLKWFEKFTKICTKHKIWYSVSGGTMIGAIREKGPIPWDDDYDVLMTMEGYEKLKKLFPTHCLDFNSRRKFPFMYCQFVPNLYDLYTNNIFVDIFLIVPTTKSKVSKYPSLLRKVQFVISYCHSLVRFKAMTKNEKIFKIISWPIHFFIKRPNYKSSAKRIIVEKNSEEFYTVLFNPMQAKYKEHSFRNLSFKTKLYPFANFKVNMIIEHHEYLSSYYGDYMTPIKWEGHEHVNVLEMR